MSVVIGRNIVSEKGEVLIDAQLYEEFFNGVNVEPINDQYFKPVGFPPIKQITVKYNPLLMLTMSGSLILVNRFHPEGLELDVGVLGIQKMIESIPLGLVDASDTLRFINIARMVDEQSEYKLMMVNYSHHVLEDLEHPLTFGKIENVKDVSHDNRGILVLTHDNSLHVGNWRQITQNNLTVKRPKYEIKRLIGRLLVCEDRILNCNNDGYLTISSRIRGTWTDIVQDHNFDLYTIDEHGTLRKYQSYSNLGNVIGFNTSRFIISRGNLEDRILIEDFEGNILDLLTHENLNYPVRLINEKLINRGRTTKSAAK